MYDPLTNELHWHHHAVHVSPILADLINHLMAPTANQRPQNPQIILQRLKEIEKELNTPNTQRQKTKFKLANASQSSGSFTTVSIGGVKPLKASSNQIHKPQNFWKVFIGLGIGCFAGGIAALNQLSANNPVLPLETVPVAIPDSAPSPVTQVPETPKEAQPNPTKSPLSLPTEDTVKAQQAQTEALEEQQRQAALKVEQDRQAALQKKLKQEAAAKAEQKKVDQDRQVDLQKKLKQEATAKAEQEKQAAIREQETARAEREKLEAARREKERQAALLAQQRQQAAIRAEQQRQALFKAEQQRQIAINFTYNFYVCPSCIVAHDNIVSREAIVTAFIEWFLKLEKPKRRELMSILGDDDGASALRDKMNSESRTAVYEYREARKRVEQQGRERRRQELLGQ